MATRTIITCDRCGDEISKSLLWNLKLLPQPEVTSLEYDLCGYCKILVKKLMEGKLSLNDS